MFLKSLQDHVGYRTVECCAWAVFQERGLRIEKVINNNVISALDDQGREIVAMGRGIGFQKKSGQEIILLLITFSILMPRS